MTTRHPLATPDAWVELRPVDELRNKHRKQLMTVLLGNIQFDDAGKRKPVDYVRAYMLGRDGAEVTAAALIVAWNIPYLPEAVLPSQDIEVLGELTIGDSDALNALVLPAMKTLNPPAVTPDDHKDESSPSVPASA